VVPAAGFLAEHVNAHKTHRAADTAIVGSEELGPGTTDFPSFDLVSPPGLLPDDFVPFACFSANNVSLKRAFLLDREERFEPRFVYPGFEGVELGLRLSRRGLRLWHHPRARVYCDQARTLADALERHYRRGRMLVVYWLLHPEQVPAAEKDFLRWLDLIQHHLIPQPDFQRGRAVRAQFSSALPAWLEAYAASLASLTAAIRPERYAPGPARALVQPAHESCGRLQQTVAAYPFELALRRGMADEWLGVGATDDNPVRDVVALLLCARAWDLSGRAPDPAAPLSAPDPASPALRFARRLKNHPWLSPLWGRMERLPGYGIAKSATKRVLNLMPRPAGR
jgi:hypothetical protein